MSTKQLVDSAIASNKAVIFSKSWCPYCRRAKGVLTSELGADKFKIYELDEMSEGEDIQAYLLEKTGQRTVPNIWINQTHVGGSDDLGRIQKSGELAKLIAA